MTQEQWIIYIYGIYPNGGFSLFYLIALIAWVVFLLTIFISNIVDKNVSWYESDKYVWNILSNKIKYIPVVVLTVLLMLSNLIPSKNIFLALVATPKLMESLESGKLKKVNELLDLALDKAYKELSKDK